MRFEISEVITQDQVMDLVYGNNSTPKRILGRHYLKDGQVIAAYHPDAVKIEMVKDSGESYDMDPIERQPVYALYLPGREPFHYKFRMTFRDGNTFLTDDPYSVPSQITEQEQDSFLNGSWVDAHRKIGCHHVTIHGVDGMYFAIWAPTARRVSVVGDFNYWNGMIYPMNRMERSGIFELFLPGLAPEHYYKFEIKTVQGNVFQKQDPYEVLTEEYPGDASGMLDLDAFQWGDASWMKNRKYRQRNKPSMAVCDVSDGENLNAQELFDGSFTHLLFSKNIMKDENKQLKERRGGICCSAYCGGSSDQFRRAVDLAHKKGISVLMELSPGFFSAQEQGGFFDGAVLYGYSDNRIGYDSRRKMWRFCFRKPEVRSLVLSVLIFWIREYHIDGFVFEGISDMICPEINISNNLDVDIIREVEQLPEDNIRFLKQAIKTVHQEDISVMMIADEQPGENSHRGRLFSLSHGFDYYWDYSVRKNMNRYLACDTGERCKEHYRLTLPLQNQELESSLLLINPVRKPVFPASIDNSAGVEYDIMSAEVRLTEAYLMGVPGRKAWSWIGTGEKEKEFIHSLFKIYREYPALYDYNLDDTSFEWMNCVDAVSSVVSFIRRSSKKNSMLLFISNFSDRTYENWRIGVQAYGRYRMILNSDDSRYGGSGQFDHQDVVSMRKRCDFRPYSIQISLPPQATLIFEYISM